jgi:hypothetical protein
MITSGRKEKKFLKKQVVWYWWVRYGTLQCLWEFPKYGDACDHVEK